ncbi:hypothetical protein [Sphingopyxis sp. GC21]|uniref:hypothetical protein n=1 Tax=Sphingopyxis sp. GC21 TaxID=2933562 RepID=UPI0021E47E3C|nr:hypothetical protein [Sphingopyxis sp. GC21]
MENNWCAPCKYNFDAYRLLTYFEAARTAVAMCATAAHAASGGKPAGGLAGGIVQIRSFTVPVTPDYFKYEFLGPKSLEILESLVGAPLRDLKFNH